MIRTVGRLLAGAVALLLAAFAAFAADPADPVPVPQLTGRVVDLTGTLAAADRDALAAKLAAFESRKGSQVAVLLVPTIGSETIEEFATRVTDAWKLGRAGVDDGVLFVIALKERRLRIQTGRGVQGVLTDALSKRIVAERVAPRFKAGDFAGGVHAGVDAILQAIETEELPPPAAGTTEQAQAAPDLGNAVENLFLIAFFILPIAGRILRSLLGRLLGALVSSGLTALGVWFLFGSLIFAGFAAFLAFLIVLSLGSAKWAAVGHGGGGWSSGGGSWSGGGGGSFSGGGGSFDGGGASGGW